MTDMVETMAYSGEVPWHQKGTPVDRAKRAEEMIVAAQMDWEVALGQVWGGPDQRLVTDRQSVYRVTDGAILGVVGNSYQPIQNRDQFSLLDSLVSDGIMQFHTAGSLDGGKQVWMMAKMEADWEIGGDRHESWLSATSRHDADGSLQIFTHDLRIVCSNTLDLALREGTRLFRVTHTGDISAKLNQARKVLQITTETQRRYQEWMKQAAKTKVKEAEVEATQTAIFGPLDDATPAQRRAAIERFMHVYDQEKAAFGATAYSLTNAVTGYGSHMLRTRGNDAEASDRRLAAIMGGSSAQFKLRGLNIVAEVTGLEALAVG